MTTVAEAVSMAGIVSAPPGASVKPLTMSVVRHELWPASHAQPLPWKPEKLAELSGVSDPKRMPDGSTKEAQADCMGVRRRDSVFAPGTTREGRRRKAEHATAVRRKKALDDARRKRAKEKKQIQQEKVIELKLEEMVAEHVASAEVEEEAMEAVLQELRAYIARHHLPLYALRRVTGFDGFAPLSVVCAPPPAILHSDRHIQSWKLTIGPGGVVLASFFGRPFPLDVHAIVTSAYVPSCLFRHLDLMSEPASPCGGLPAELIQERIRLQGRDLEHIVRDGELFRSRSCVMHVPVPACQVGGSSIADSVALGQEVAGAGALWSTPPADFLLRYGQFLALDFAISDIETSLLGHYVLKGDAVAVIDGIKIVELQGMQTQVMYGRRCRRVDEQAMGKSTPIFVTLFGLQTNWQVSAVYSPTARNVALLHRAAGRSIRCKSCTNAFYGTKTWLTRNMKNETDKKQRKKLTCVVNNHTSLFHMSATLRKMRGQNQRKTMSRLYQHKQQQNARRVDNLEPEQ